MNVGFVQAPPRRTAESISAHPAGIKGKMHPQIMSTSFESVTLYKVYTPVNPK